MITSTSIGSCSAANHVPVRPDARDDLVEADRGSRARGDARRARARNASGGEYAGSAAALTGSQKNAATGAGARLVEHAIQRGQRLPRRSGRSASVEGGMCGAAARCRARSGPCRPGPARQRERHHRRPVIGLRRRDDARAVGLAALDVVAAREPHRRLVGLRPAADEVHALEPGGRVPRSAHRASRLLGRARELLVVDEREPLRLLRRRLDRRRPGPCPRLVTIAPPLTASR